MTLEDTIKSYEARLPKEKVRDIKRYVRECYELMPDVFHRGDYSKLYREILIQEYLRINNLK